MRFSFIRSTRTRARSYCACCTSQLLELPPKTLDNRTAISGEIPRFSFTSSDNVVRVTPRNAAASVMLKPKGSMHWRNTKASRVGWVLNRHFLDLLSVVVHVINVKRVGVGKTENHPPVCPYRYRP